MEVITYAHIKHIRWLCIALLLILGGAYSLNAQQITKFGVVDTARVYQAYYKNSSAVRDYEDKKAQWQKEINLKTQELQKLNEQKLEYINSGDDSAALKLETEISRKTDYLREYTIAKNAELESLKKSMQNSDAFYKRLYATLAKIAESGGYSMILNLQEANAILWYSPSVDLTDQVIAQLEL